MRDLHLGYQDDGWHCGTVLERLQSGNNGIIVDLVSIHFDDVNSVSLQTCDNTGI